MLLLGMCVLFTSNIFAQVKVSGVVKSSSGEILPGATIVVKGTTNGVVTDADGKYSITVPNASSTLVISFIGMTSQQIAVNGKSTINVSLASTTVGIEEVVVTAMGITREKKSLAYSVSTVNTDDLVQAGQTNLMKSIDGKVSGVNLTSLSSDPTSSVLVNIRGTTAMPSPSNANVTVQGQPLYVIDGIPVGTQTFTSYGGVDFGNILSQLNPEDIASVTILKGGSAGALYGANGGNGVVMITTKSGKGGKKGIGVSVSETATMESAYQIMQVQNIFGQGERNDVWAYDNTDTWGPALDGTTTTQYWDTKTQQWATKAMYSYKEDRVKAFLRQGSTMTTNVNVNGNYDKGSFRLSLSNMGNQGVMPNTQSNQKSVTFASEYKMTDKVKVSINASYLRTVTPNKANVVGSNGVMNQLLFNFPSNLQPLSQMKNYWMNGFTGIMENGAIMKPNGTDVQSPNPWWVANEEINEFTRDNFFGKVQLDYKINKDFAVLLRTGMENVVENYEYRQSFGARGMSSRASSGDGAFSTNLNKSLGINSDVIVSYNHAFGKFDLSALGGFNYAYSTNSSDGITASSLSVPGLFSMANAFPGHLSASYSWGAAPSSSLYATADAGWNKQLFLGLTGRQDWIGNLPEQKINYFYPSASLSWIASETFKLPEAINLLKIRLGLADVGNGLTRQRAVNTYSFISPDWSSTIKTANVNATLVDPHIKPMSSITKEVGFDLWMFNKRVQADFTYFQKDQNNQLGQVPLVQGTGYTSMTANVGDVSNKGFEWGLTVIPVKSKDWNWSITGSFTHYLAKISRLSAQFAPNGYIFAGYDGKTDVKIAKGEQIGNIYEDHPILKVLTGKYKGMPILDGSGGEFQDGNGADREMLGNYNPKFIFGINQTLRYKNWSLTAVGSLRYGGKYVSVNQQYMDSNGKSVESLSSGPNNKYWSGGRNAAYGGHAWPAANASIYGAINNNTQNWAPLTEHDASYAKGVFVNPNIDSGVASSDADYIVNGADPNNTFYQQPTNSWGDCIWDFTATRTYDATNFKLKELALTYTLPNAISQKLSVNNVNISFIGRNVFQWNANGRHEDPESAFSGVGTNQGILRATLPSIRSLGFKLGFDF